MYSMPSTNTVHTYTHIHTHAPGASNAPTVFHLEDTTQNPPKTLLISSHSTYVYTMQDRLPSPPILQHRRKHLVDSYPPIWPLNARLHPLCMPWGGEAWPRCRFVAWLFPVCVCVCMYMYVWGMTTLPVCSLIIPCVCVCMYVYVCMRHDYTASL